MLVFIAAQFYRKQNAMSRITSSFTASEKSSICSKLNLYETRPSESRQGRSCIVPRGCKCTH
jgi:hypothetical protein